MCGYWSAPSVGHADARAVRICDTDGLMGLITRRRLLGTGVVIAAGGAGVAVGATRHLPVTHRTPPARLVAALAREQQLIASIDAATTAAPDRASVLSAIRSDHVAHRAALQALVTGPLPLVQGHCVVDAGIAERSGRGREGSPGGRRGGLLVVDRCARRSLREHLSLRGRTRGAAVVTSPSAVPSVVADPAVNAWQQAVAAEYAAAFGYGALGPKTYRRGAGRAGPHVRAGPPRRRQRQCSEVDRTRRRAGGAGGELSVAFALTDAAAAQQLALRLEAAGASAWRYVTSIDRAAADVRALAVSMLSDSAVRGVQWRRLATPAAPTVPFPGI